MTPRGTDTLAPPAFCPADRDLLDPRARVVDPIRLPALSAVRDLLATERARVRRILTEVCTYHAAEYEIDAALKTLDGAAAEIATYQPVRVSRLAAFMPSNMLLYSYVLYLLVPALFADRICFRPSSRVSSQQLRLHELLASVHRLPVLPMAVSQRNFLRDGVTQADVVVFTGTYQNAEHVRPQLRPEQLFLYLGGGANPFVVTPGADLAHAVRDAIEVRLLNSGQDCLAPDVFFVPAGDRDAFVDRLVQRLTGLRYGPGPDPDADYGPIVYDSALERAAQYLFRHERQIRFGGNVDFARRRIDPAVVVTELAGKLGRTELFAPIFHVVSYPDEDALIRTVTTGSFAERALGASVYGVAPKLIAALADRHLVTVDSSLLTADDGNAPFGGRGPMANHIGHLGRVYAEPILVSKAASEHLASEAARDLAGAS